jgi:hypothetical protein
MEVNEPPKLLLRFTKIYLADSLAGQSLEAIDQSSIESSHFQLTFDHWVSPRYAILLFVYHPSIMPGDQDFP